VFKLAAPTITTRLILSDVLDKEKVFHILNISIPEENVI
jgi:hypothetical protein